MSTVPVRRIAPALLYFLALCTGASAACIYLSQPLLHVLGQNFGVANDQIGLIASLTQIGYALGLFFLIPLGDVIPKRKIILTKQACLTLILILTATTTNWPSLFGLSLLLGISASVTQDFIPLASDLAHESHRGRTIGIMMSGLFTGILCSRTLSGVIADLAGWRAVFGIFAALTALLATIGFMHIPANVPPEKTSYPKLIASLFRHFRQKPRLRYSLLTQGLLSIAFSAFWTSLAFFLSEPEFHLSTTQIGLFGIAGAAGVLAAPVAGRMADKYSPYRGVLIGIVLVIVSFIVMMIVPRSLPVLVVGAVVFDMGLQMAQISHQAIIYAIDAAAKSRINGIFYAGLFSFMAFGSFVSVRVEKSHGWIAVLAVSLASGILALGTALIARAKFSPAGSAA